ncbi:cytochrome P450 [Streptomyces sp. NPDC051162]|uniref:cytochrome P450 family protein n=1 Tax=unclassified Streptomyces TaxID=2593676 RepID=UPI00344A143F
MRETELLPPSFADRAHAVHRLWREGGGVRRVRYPGPAPVEGWVVTGYDDARRLLADPRLSKQDSLRKAGQHAGLTEGPGAALFTHMLNSDPPGHTRLRKLVRQAFTAHRTAALRPLVEARVTALLDAWEGREEAELISEFALPLAMAVVFDLLGASDTDHEVLRVRGNTLGGDDGDGEVSVSTAENMRARLGALVALKRENPDDGMLSALAAARNGDDALSEDELTSMAFLLVVAGHQTTVNLIANGVHTLLTHPGQLDALRADPSLMPGAVEEILRYESPSGLASARYATEPVTVGGVTVPAGDFVHVCPLGANRDPAVFDDPDRFDIRRGSASKHLAFGHGIHHCLGAPLARLQAEIAFTGLLARFPGLRLAEGYEARWQSNPRHRGLVSLPLRLR